MTKAFKMLWVGRSKNDKTGDIPQGYVGKDKEQTEHRVTVAPCARGAAITGKAMHEAHKPACSVPTSTSPNGTHLHTH